jgi:hypothetical protein
VNFPEDDPKLMARLILFLYTEDFPAWDYSEPQLPAWNRHQQKACPASTTKWMNSLRSLLHSSDRTDTVFINSSHAKIFEKDYRESLTTIVLIHTLAVKMEVPKLEIKVRQEYLKVTSGLPHSKCKKSGETDFLTSIKTIYRTTSDTDRSLRDIALFAVQGRLKRLRECTATKGEGDDDDKNFRKTLLSMPEFAVELLTFNQRGRSFWCDHCKRRSFGNYVCACGMRDLCGDSLCIYRLKWKGVGCRYCAIAGRVRTAKAEDPPRGTAGFADEVVVVTNCAV